MTRYRNRFPIAALIIVGASLFAPARAVVAQGALQARARETAPAPAAESSLQPAHSVLHQLVGRWRFAIWFAGNFDGPPDASGTRVVDTLYNNLRLQWSEQLDHSASLSQGIIGFDSETGRFYSSAVYSDGAGVELLSGTVSPSDPLVTFSPVTPAANADRRQMQSFTLTLIDPDHFTWVPLDRGWRAVFTREP
jgi:uncharacterized protein DUF1579